MTNKTKMEATMCGSDKVNKVPIAPVPPPKPYGFQDVIAPQLGLPAAPPLFAPRIERAAATAPQYTTDAAGVKRPVKTGFQSLQITRQP